MVGDRAFVGSQIEVLIHRRIGGEWQLEQGISGPSNSRFGTALAAAGTTLVVGAPFHDHSGFEDAGAAYVFELIDGVWTETQKLTASDPDEDGWFGHALALQGDTLLVGAPRRDFGEEFFVGAVYVFERSGGTWTETGILVPSDARRLFEFGRAVALDLPWALIGAPEGERAYLFELVNGAWTERQRFFGGDEDEFGWSVDLKGGVAAVGAPYADHNGFEDSGTANLYRFDGSDWTSEQGLFASDTSAFNSFGWSVEIVDADRIIIGGRDWDGGAGVGNGVIYDVHYINGTWTETDRIVPEDRDQWPDNWFGYSLASSADTLLVGAPFDNENGTRAGAAYIFSLSGFCGAPGSLTDLQVFGDVVGGGLDEIRESDDELLSVRSRPGFQLTEPAIVHLTVGATSPLDAPSAINLLYEGRISQPGGTVRVELKNWNSGGFEEVDAFAIGTTEETHITSGIPAMNFVRASDNRIEVRYRIVVVNLFQIAGFTSHTDQIAVRVVE